MKVIITGATGMVVFMKPTPGQKSIKPFFKFLALLYPLFYTILPNSISTLKQLGQAMINAVLKGYNKSILKVKHINLLAKGYFYLAL